MAEQKYSPEFKDACVQEVIRSSRTIAQVARENGVVQQTLRNWVNAYKKQHPAAEPELSVSERARLKQKLGIARSVGRTGICYDNAWAESFNGTLKNERVHRTEYPTREHARFDITRYIELRYNTRRLHSTLGYRTPNEVEEAWHAANIAA